MLKKKFLSLLVLCLSFFGFLGVQAKTAKEIYRSYKDSVLLLKVETASGPGTGTAFAIGENGLFATAAHVIKGSKSAFLVTSSGQPLPVKSVLWLDENTDLAVFQVEGKQKFKALPLASYQSTEVGENLTIISFPKAALISDKVGTESTLSVGMLSSIRENFVTERKEDPIYDKSKPKLYNAERFYEDLKANCEIKAQETQKKLTLLECKNGKSVMANGYGDLLFDNLDLAIRKGEQVLYFANKNPKALQPQKTVGRMLQFTTPISPGSSGAPVFNEQGEVIAIVNSYLQDAQNLNFGRPIDYLPKQFTDAKYIALSAPTK